MFNGDSNTPKTNSTAPAVATHPNHPYPRTTGAILNSTAAAVCSGKKINDLGIIIWLRPHLKIEHKSLTFRPPRNRGAIQFCIAPVVRGKIGTSCFHNRGCG